MGIGLVNPESGDAQRIFVLESLLSLQQTRQLKNVRWAREIVEAVWKMRDLQGPEYMGGWYDIGRVECYGPFKFVGMPWQCRDLLGDVTVGSVNITENNATLVRNREIN
ncbi:unnamed protein product [Clonostachys rosea f. rosea IK726]|uniref:Uncharacterized protein n=1 Tax=Clonostachys rosea f. rosea IK726 TaxID=1349383 RepID=A0ACA9UBV0_BIOOC|nr:unnamed protein product [Clonostachys rosea f. rosea IK726]